MSDAMRPGSPAQRSADNPGEMLRQVGGEARRDAREMGSEARGATASAGEELRSTASRVGEEARGTASRVGEEARGAVEDLKAEGGAVVEAARDRAMGFAEEQKRAGAEQAEGLARAVHRAAEELQGSAPQLAQYVHEAASSVDGLARALRDRSPGELMGRVQDLARRQPMAFFGASVLAGFALARFAKSSAEAARSPGMGGSMQTYGSGAGWREGHAQGGGTATPRPSAMGAPGWVPAGGRAHDDAAPASRPATMAAASLGGAAARPAGQDHATPTRSGPQGEIG